ncbi:MAG: hypothetical protein QOJ03_2134 [Frankiaceae bacterium]|jgi:hypothetical protein|nr:hypothetical protein [Frankiaceae bacterium]
MKSRKFSLAAATTAAGVALLAPTAAFAAGDPTCDAYSKKCTHVKGHKITRPPTVVKAEHQTLPFTGGEIVLMTTLGAAALGAGATFVVAGRRRRTAAEA